MRICTVVTANLLIVVVAFAHIANHWFVEPSQTVFSKSEAISFSYSFENSDTHDVWVPKSVNPYMNVKFVLYGPTGDNLVWNGAKYSFGYKPSDFVRLRPGEKLSGSFTVPQACPDEKELTKGGFCFQQEGKYRGRIEFQVGLNASTVSRGLPKPLLKSAVTDSDVTFEIR
jgi:hypothetical protein